MKILFFTASVDIGGIERVFLSYATGLIDIGHEVHYVTCWEGGALGVNFPKGIIVHGLGNVRLRYSVLRMRRILKDIKPDVLITGNDSTLVAYLARLLTFSKNIKLITSQHSYFDNSETLFYSKPILKYIFPRCDKVIAVSNGIGNMLKDRFYMDKPLVHVINNPVDFKKLQLDATSYNYDVNGHNRYVTFVGRMTPVKNLRFLMDAFQIFWKTHQDFYLVMVGDGYERKDIEEYIKEKPFKKNVVFEGVKSNPFPILKHSQMLLLPSTSEAYPTVLIEAMCFGKTCVCTPTNGAIDILENGKYGYITSMFDNPQEYATKMEIALVQPMDADVLRDFVEKKYSLKVKVKELLDTING